MLIKTNHSLWTQQSSCHYPCLLDQKGPLLPPTPLQESMVLTQEIFGLQKGVLHPRKVHLKYENKHMTGSFKERGAINKLASLTAEQRERGVVASSAGNQ